MKMAVFQRQPGLDFMRAVRLNSVRVIQVALVVKACRDHEKRLRIDTVKGKKRSLVKVQSQWQLKAQD